MTGDPAVFPPAAFVFNPRSAAEHRAAEALLELARTPRTLKARFPERPLVCCNPRNVAVARPARRDAAEMARARSKTRKPNMDFLLKRRF